MNTRIKREVNSKNMGIRIMQNGALDQKIWALEALKGKIVNSGDSREFLESLEWLEGLDTKDMGSCKVWEFFGDFGGFLKCLEGFRTYF
jgi:hypothetical protein